MNYKSVQYVTEYEDKIIQGLFEEEYNQKKKLNYDDQQPQIVSEQSRAELIDWLITIHHRLIGPMEETLHIAVNIIDRILMRNVTQIENLHTLAITAFLIATKFEDII